MNEKKEKTIEKEIMQGHWTFGVHFIVILFNFVGFYYIQ